MKKFFIGGAIVALVLVLLGVNLYLGSREEGTASSVSESTFKTVKESPSASSETAQTSAGTVESTSTSGGNQGSVEAEIETMLQDFSTKWVNFDDIYKRNQSVRNYLTDNCIKENTIDVDPNVSYECKGSISSIARDIANDHRFIVTGSEEMNGYTNDFVLIIALDAENIKIDAITTWYVRTGY